MPHKIRFFADNTANNSSSSEDDSVEKKLSAITEYPVCGYDAQVYLDDVLIRPSAFKVEALPGREPVRVTIELLTDDIEINLNKALTTFVPAAPSEEPQLGIGEISPTSYVDPSSEEDMKFVRNMIKPQGDITSDT